MEEEAVEVEGESLGNLISQGRILTYRFVVS